MNSSDRKPSESSLQPAQIHVFFESIAKAARDVQSPFYAAAIHFETHFVKHLRTFSRETRLVLEGQIHSLIRRDFFQSKEESVVAKNIARDFKDDSRELRSMVEKDNHFIDELTERIARIFWVPALTGALFPQRIKRTADPTLSPLVLSPAVKKQDAEESIPEVKPNDPELMEANLQRYRAHNSVDKAFAADKEKNIPAILDFCRKAITEQLSIAPKYVTETDKETRIGIYRWMIKILQLQVDEAERKDEKLKAIRYYEKILYLFKNIPAALLKEAEQCQLAIDRVMIAERCATVGLHSLQNNLPYSLYCFRKLSKFYEKFPSRFLPNKESEKDIAIREKYIVDTLKYAGNYFFEKKRYKDASEIYHYGVHAAQPIDTQRADRFRECEERALNAMPPRVSKSGIFAGKKSVSSSSKSNAAATPPPDAPFRR